MNWLEDECLSLDGQGGGSVADGGITHRTALTRLRVLDELERVGVPVSVLAQHCHSLRAQAKGAFLVSRSKKTEPSVCRNKQTSPRETPNQFHETAPQ